MTCHKQSCYMLLLLFVIFPLPWLWSLLVLQPGIIATRLLASLLRDCFVLLCWPSLAQRACCFPGREAAASYLEGQCLGPSSTRELREPPPCGLGCDRRKEDKLVSLGADLSAFSYLLSNFSFQLIFDARTSNKCLKVEKNAFNEFYQTGILTPKFPTKLPRVCFHESTWPACSCSFGTEL